MECLTLIKLFSPPRQTVAEEEEEEEHVRGLKSVLD
jgi:hypothetical protein